MGKIIMVTGGARSGKSTFGESYVAKYGKKIAYIATSQIYDKEMEFRVKLHQERRPQDWVTFECPFDAHELIAKEGTHYDMFLFDCMTLYISNILSKVKDIDEFDKNHCFVMDKINILISAIKQAPTTVLIVTNEVGAGIVPESRLGRVYRDLAGLVNQTLAGAAEEVYLVVSGIPINIKNLAEDV